MNQPPRRDNIAVYLLTAALLACAAGFVLTMIIDTVVQVQMTLEMEERG